MRKAVWTGKEQTEVVQTDDPPPQILRPDDVLLRVTAAGVCGTDIHIWEQRLSIAHPPLVLGHEIAAVVDKCGPAVKHLKPGDRVKCDSVVGCGKCEWCQRGATQFCPDGWEFGITRDGGWADWLVAPARNLRKLPAEISDEVAAIMDVEVYGALRKPGVRSGETIAILGAGPAGLIGLQVARLLGAGRVILCGTRPERLELAKRLGADEVIDSRACDANEAVKDLTGGLGVDLAMDAAGTDLAIQQAIRMVRPQGRVVLYGVLGHAMRDFPSDEIVLKDLILYGALPDRTGWEEFIEWVASGQLDLASLITHRFPLEQAGEALRFMRDRKEGAIKAVLRISGAEGIPAETASASLKQSQLGPGAC